MQMVAIPPYRGRFTREMVQAELNRFHYDTAQVSLAGTLSALAKLVPVSQILYGTDFPYRAAAEQSKGVDALLDEADRKQVNRENALRILPRLGGAYSAATPYALEHPEAERVNSIGRRKLGIAHPKLTP